MADGTAKTQPNPVMQTIQVSDRLVAKTLEPYKPECRYLKSAVVEYAKDDPFAHLSMRGKFSIPESCYIADTGHFNAVEFNICFNQLAYTIVAACIENRVLPVFNHLTLDEYHRRQLGHFLIVSLQSRFSSQINARDFEGTIHAQHMNELRGTVVFHTTCEFTDSLSGRARGKVTLAMLDIAPAPKTPESQAT